MYLSGIVVTLVGTYLSDGAEIQQKGFFYGYTYYVWFVICKYPGIKGLSRLFLLFIVILKLDVCPRHLQHFGIIPDIVMNTSSEYVILFLLTCYPKEISPSQ